MAMNDSISKKGWRILGKIVFVCTCGRTFLVRRIILELLVGMIMNCRLGTLADRVAGMTAFVCVRLDACECADGDRRSDDVGMIKRI